VVSEVKVIYFDTIPICTSLSVLKTGFLFAAVESGNQYAYFFSLQFIFIFSIRVMF
jgi:splicing factor 3B subunit 3